MKKSVSDLLKNLFDLLQRLYSGEKLSAKEIARLYDVNLRTAQRYPEYLKKAGFVIKKENTKHCLELPVGIESILDIAQKLNLSVPIIDKLQISIYYSKIDIEKPDLNKLKILEDSIKNKNKLEIIYEEFEGYENKLTNVKPLKIANFEGYWYLLALNYKDEYRRYHINSMKEIKILEDTFFIDDEFIDKINKKAVNIWYDPFKEPYLVELFLDDIVTKYFKRLPPFKPLHFKEEKDGSSIVIFEITDEMEILPFILRWIPHVKIISPQKLKKEVLNKIEKYFIDIK